jgi:hypothetical protein
LPARASIIKGKYPARLHPTGFIAGDSFPHEKYTQSEWQIYPPQNSLAKKMPERFEQLKEMFYKWSNELAV